MKSFNSELFKWIRSKNGTIVRKQGILTISFLDGSEYDFTVPKQLKAPSKEIERMNKRRNDVLALLKAQGIEPTN